MATIAAPARETRLQVEPPYGAYAAIMGVFAGGLGTAGLLSRVIGRDPQCQTALGLVVLSAASYKAARTLYQRRGDQTWPTGAQAVSDGWRSRRSSPRGSAGR
jgi:hypothetical protein